MKFRIRFCFLRALLSAAVLSALLPLHAEEAKKVFISTGVTKGQTLDARTKTIPIPGAPLQWRDAGNITDGTNNDW